MWSVFFVFLSYLDGEFVKADFLSNSLEAEKESKEFFYLLNNTLCAKRSNVGEYHLFQLSDGIEEVRSVHDATGKLVDCALTTDPMQVQSFMYMCKVGLGGQVTVSTALIPSCTNITDVKLKCLQLKSRTSVDAAVAVSSNEIRERGKVEGKRNPSVLRRSKRGFTYPGTLWCGAGNNAEHYDQLGEFAETDKCCRVHDHCPDVIHAFSSNYGYTNFKWHSISHCDCDNAMKECLRKVNDTSSRVVGQAFFNVIEVPCFELSYEEQCVERHWYGVCKRYDKVPVAVLKESIPYDFGGIDVIDELPLPPMGKTQEPDAEPAETTEGATQSTTTSSSASQTSTPEAPSLTNMVTAAEDFIKVLATVSTSQGSSPDAAKEETQGSEKKRKKNAGGKKRKNKKRRGKGRGRKRRPNVETVVKTDEGAVGAPSCHIPEEVTSRTNIIDDPSRTKQMEASVDNFMKSEADMEIKEELSNSMMRDDPQEPAGATSTSTPAESVKAVRQTDEDSDSERELSPTTSPSSTVYLGITKIKTHRERVRLGQKSLKHKLRAVTPSSSTLKPPHEATQDTQSITTSVRDDTTIERLQTEAAGQPSSGTLGHASKEGPVVTTAGAPTTNPHRAKRLRSKERGGRKRAGKGIPLVEQEESHLTDSKEEPTVVTPVLSTSEVSTLGYHVLPKRLDYLSVARLARPTISKRIEPSRNGKRQRSKESRERRKSHIFGTTFAPTATLAPTPAHTAPVQYSDKADYEVLVTAGASATTVPPASDTSTFAQLRPAIRDTSTQETLLFPLTGIPPGGTHKPKRKKQRRHERKKPKKALLVLSGA